MEITDEVSDKNFLTIEDDDRSRSTIISATDKWYGGHPYEKLIKNYHIYLINDSLKITGTRIYRKYFSTIGVFGFDDGRPKLKHLDLYIPESRQVVNRIIEREDAWFGLTKVKRVKWVRYKETTKFFHLTNNFKIST